jgi:hypothetical protein
MSADFFEQGVANTFRPFAVRAGLPLRRLQDGVYEMSGCQFLMRIRRGTGHGKDFLITLSRKEHVSDDPMNLTGEIGLGVITEYNGKDETTAALALRDGSLPAFRIAAEAAEEFCLPYLLGEKSDFADLQQFLRDKVERSQRAI